MANKAMSLSQLLSTSFTASMYSSSMFLCSLTHLCTYITAFFGWFCITTNKYITMHYFLSRQLMAMQAITPHRQEKYTNIMHEVFEKTINVSKARIDNIDQDRKKKQRIETRDDHKYAEGGRSSLSTVNLAFPLECPSLPSKMSGSEHD